ncbi:hypothetical protein ACU686_20540 [Yinghuangia aomiensis]
MSDREPLFAAAVPSAEVARVLNSALAFCPRGSPVPLVRLEFTRDRLGVLGTDCYTVGTDCTDVDRWASLVDSHTVWIDREAAEPSRKRPARTRSPRPGHRTTHPTAEVSARSRTSPGDALVFRPQLNGADVSAKDLTGRYGPVMTPSGMRTPDGVWTACDDLLERPGRRRDPLAFNPDYLSRLKKVRTPGTEIPIADFYFDEDADLRVLIKLGSRFRGAVMTIDRQVAATNDKVSEQEGLW